MDKGFNLKVSEYKTNIIRGINDSGLPISVISMIFREIVRDLEKVETETLQNEMQAYTEAMRVKYEAPSVEAEIINE